MNKEQEFLIKAINDYLNQKETSSVMQLDWNLVYKYSKQQQLQGLIYYQCESIIDNDDVRSRLEEASLSQFANSINRQELISQLKNILNNAQIDYSLVCFLQDLFGENCKTFLANVASPNWRKLQSFWTADYQSVKLCRLVTFAG